MLPHDDECELGQFFISPVTGGLVKKLLCRCQRRRLMGDAGVEEQPVSWSWLHGSSGGVPAP